MELRLYHGSEFIIAEPKLSRSRPHNDYGRGFYCTQEIELAKEWACGSGRDGYANEYLLQTDGLSVLNLFDQDHNILNWLAILTRYRTYWQRNSIAEEAKEYIAKEFLIDISPYDIIRGYRADDSYFSFAQDFVSGAISLQKLSEAMHLGRLGEQIVLKTEKAFSALTYVRSIPADADEYYARKAARDLQARRDYRKTRRGSDLSQEIYIIDIMREGMKNGDPRLQ